MPPREETSPTAVRESDADLRVAQATLLRCREAFFRIVGS